jgi:hypothetical protein
MSGAGIMLISADVPQGSLCTSDAVSALLERLEFALGEGPCLDACSQDRAVLEPDLLHPGTTRWLAFGPPAIEAGVRAIFAIPLRVGAIRLGALNLYNKQPGALTDDQHADALVMADVAARAVLALQADASPGRLSAELKAGSDFHHLVHQASGMVSVQLAVGLGQAIVRLKAYAFANDRALNAVAADVVARRLRFCPDTYDAHRS